MEILEMLIGYKPHDFSDAVVFGFFSLIATMMILVGWIYPTVYSDERNENASPIVVVSYIWGVLAIMFALIMASTDNGFSFYEFKPFLHMLLINAIGASYRGVRLLCRIFIGWRKWAPMSLSAYWKQRDRYDTLALQNEAKLAEMSLKTQAKTMELRSQRMKDVRDAWEEQAKNFTPDTKMGSEEVRPVMPLVKDEIEWWNALTIERIHLLKFEALQMKLHIEVEEAKIALDARKEVELLTASNQVRIEVEEADMDLDAKKKEVEQLIK